MDTFNRKQFLSRSILGAAGFIFVPQLILAQDPVEKGPPLDPLAVKEFVGAAHKDMSKVQLLLEEKPDLLNAVSNLGAWDWEDAVSAAGHVGYHELAGFLLKKGARLTLCVAAMLGKLEIVKATIMEFPYMKDMVGPHKISILRHAKAGGEKSRAVAEYLIRLGAKE